MLMLERRLQILIDEDRHRRITAVARERGVPVSVVVREAIDRGIADPEDRRARAASRILAADDMDVPDTAALLDEIDQFRSRRA
jgi:predicted DNA-binding protein